MNTILLQGLLFQINSEAERFLPLELEYECSKKQINYARGGRQKACSTAGGKSSTTLNTKPCSSQYFGFSSCCFHLCQRQYRSFLFSWVLFDQRKPMWLSNPSSEERERERMVNLLWRSHWAAAAPCTMHSGGVSWSVTSSVVNPGFPQSPGREFHVMDSWTPNSKLVEI